VVTTPQRARFVVIGVLALASLGVSCDPPATSSTSSSITRDKAIEIARQETKLTAGENVEAVQVTSNGKAVWRVTFKYRLPDQPPGLYETRSVELDAQTGKIVGASIN